jgi:hypothetical protein
MRLGITTNARTNATDPSASVGAQGRIRRRIAPVPHGPGAGSGRCAAARHGRGW